MPLRRYTFKLYPNKTQLLELDHQRRMHAWLWNGLLEQRETQWRHECQRKAKGERRGLTYFDQTAEITKLRASDEGYRAMNAMSLHRTAQLLDAAFKAFFSRAKAGAGASSGYPRFKRADRHETIPFKNQGWKLFSAKNIGDEPMGRPTPRQSDASREAKVRAHELGAPPRSTVIARPGLRLVCANELGVDGDERAKSGGALHLARAHELGEGNGPVGRSQLASAQKLGEGSWRLIVHGVTGSIRARGKFPVEPESFKNAEIIYRDEAWWFSVCVDMPVRRVSGEATITVRLDLIDEFARVERVEGRPPPRPTAAPEAELCAFADVEVEVGCHDQYGRGKTSRTCADVERDVDEGNGRHAGLTSHARTDVEQRIDNGRDRSFDEDLAAKLRICITLQDKADAVASDRDLRLKRGSCAYRAATARAVKLRARAARRRREALHVWTTRITASSSDMTIVSPPIKEITKTEAGDEKNFGAAVKTAAKTNRHILAQAPASAIQMLTYKAEEAGVRCDVVKSDDHRATIHHDISTATKAVRRLRRQIKKAA